MQLNYEEIYQRIWQLSPEISNKRAYEELVKLTQSLINIYTHQGRLTTDPFEPTRGRQLSLPYEKINPLLKNSTCLVTGGLGCVGTTLVNELLKFDIKRIIILDKNENLQHLFNKEPKVTTVIGDIRDEQFVQSQFDQYHPEFIFHTAAQRNPGYSESHIYETVSTNVLGTFNVVKACEKTGSVKQFVFSSTGKASRYYTEEVYAGTKKMCEYILEAYSKGSRLKYSMVRFTHILDNSLMDIQLKDEVQNKNFVGVHSPGKYVTAQNVREASHLMLNAIAYSEFDQSNFLLVRNLEWPVESLEMALYYIKESGKQIPVSFIGNPVGYTEKFFRGQLDWSNPCELNLLINVYENQYRKYSESGDILISHISPINTSLLKKALENLGNETGENEIKQTMITGLKEIITDSLNYVDKNITAKILKWGLQPEFMLSEKAKIEDYGLTVPMLRESLWNTPTREIGNTFLHPDGFLMSKRMNSL